MARLENLGNLELKGLRRPVAAFNVMQSTGAADARPKFDRRREGTGGLLLDNAKVSQPLPANPDADAQADVEAGEPTAPAALTADPAKIKN